jgi:hypothetical protein
MGKSAKYSKFDKALDPHHEKGSRLARMNTADGLQWFIIHRRGELAKPEDAAKIRAPPDIRGNRESLFPKSQPDLPHDAERLASTPGTVRRTRRVEDTSRTPKRIEGQNYETSDTHEHRYRRRQQVSGPI